MSEKEHAFEKLVQNLSAWQKKFRTLLNLMPVSEPLPLLSPPEGFGSNAERFRNPELALVSWRDKQCQIWTARCVLEASEQRSVTLQFRFVERHTQQDFVGAIPARWLVPTIFSAQVLISDPQNGDRTQVYRTDQFSSLIRQSGFSDSNVMHVEIGGWKLEKTEHGYSLRLAIGSGDQYESFDIEAFSGTPRDALVLHGQEGYTENRFVCSTRTLKAEGTWIYQQRRHSVTGSFYLEHEKLAPPHSYYGAHREQYLIELTKGSTLYLSKSAGDFYATFVDSDGSVRRLVRDDVQLKVVEWWKSPHTGARYPVWLKFSSESLDIEIDLRASEKAQECDPLQSTLEAFWCGTVVATGSFRGKPIKSIGFAEYHGQDPRRRVRVARFLTN